jgi:predicted secreted Zn-dependent protease
VKKRIIALLFMTTAGTAFAADGTAVAYRDTNLPLSQKNGPAAPKVTETHDYYEIKGDCENDLRRQLRKNGIRWRDGKKYDSMTSWRVKWDFGPDAEAKICTVDDFRVNVEIIFRYPRWVSNDNAPQPLVEKWGRYIQNLTLHENGHRDMVAEAAADLSHAVADLPPGLTCEELKRKACELCCERMRKLKKDEKEYDELTAHGVTQGAVFP